MKTQDNKSILIELGKEGWKFTCENYQIEIDNGLYFGKKNTYIVKTKIFLFLELLIHKIIILNGN